MLFSRMNDGYLGCSLTRISFSFPFLRNYARKSPLGASASLRAKPTVESSHRCHEQCSQIIDHGYLSDPSMEAEATYKPQVWLQWP